MKEREFGPRRGKNASKGAERSCLPGHARGVGGVKNRGGGRIQEGAERTRLLQDTGGGEAAEYKRGSS